MHVVFEKAEELVCAITFKRYRESAKKDLPCKYSETEVLKEPYMIIRDREKPQDVADDGFCECCKIRYTSLQHVYVCYDPFFSCRSNLFLGYKNYIDGKIKMIVF
ncbi:uncharacterized protein LOC130641842 isoform X5 [Hydractinia symbiolongicarpus]|uniref:uncharacterized protein LOC130621601 isoform X5 n=1 Tax=Hydractinia symbiolongicarpus TaxID=13093 RepID=UPI00254CB94C|nr:uncharacterized protein LOC130621601 isoform X5 [Hydractinia symbiolongicarpus]XP_057304818.1 uncharacterized protein LOC130641842 isoform X5 [Hydractinia symbiolongicarpus]